MSELQTCFRRYEKKYLLTKAQYLAVRLGMAAYMKPDAHPRYSITNIYYDTEHYDLIRASLGKPVYKEKLRLRSYGTPNDDSTVFLELKKKFGGVVYKRREAMPLHEALTYLSGGPAPRDTQIMHELDYAMQFYNQPAPAMFIAYERDAWFVRDDEQIRITFDSNARYRATGLDLRAGSGGTALLPEGTVILEVKTIGAMPLWLADALCDCHILPGSFSKYGAAYERTQRHAITMTQGEYDHVSNF